VRGRRNVLAERQRMHFRRNAFGTVVVLVFFSALAGATAAMVPIEPEEMLATVKQLADERFQGRGIGTQELDQAAALIASRFESVGLLPGGDSGGWYQEWTDPELKVAMRNVVGVLPGRSAVHTGESVVVGAHYDHLGLGSSGARPPDRGRVHPGADDNASGVAVLLELASRLVLAPNMERTVVFVAFTGEETGRKGSRYFVRNERRYPPAKAVGMINLDTVGRLGKGKLIVIGAASAKEWTPLFEEIGKATKVEIALPAQELDASDQVSFHEAGVPAVQLFSGPHLDYHRPTDTADKIDGQGMVKVATVARSVIYTLANLPGRLTSMVTPMAVLPGAASQRARNVSLGIVPDFTYNEQGVRLGGTVPGGPAEGAGLQTGDIIVRAGTREVRTLKDLSDVLKAASPGERLSVRFLRNGSPYQVTVEVREK
jgi:aminopeptidase N